MRTKKFMAVPNPDGYGFRVRWPDGVLSTDYYNLMWAKEHARVLQETESRIVRGWAGIGPEKPVGAFKCSQGTQIA